MNTKMWVMALRIIPRITKEEWQKLDVISKWLIITRARLVRPSCPPPSPVSVFRDGAFNRLWALVAFGLVMAHATNNIFNDFTDYTRGVDQDNYYRAQYGPQPLVHGLMSKRQLLTFDAVTGLIALACGLVLALYRGGWTWLLLGLGVFFVMFYTWPLKYIALGELAVLLVWGPLMIGGGYYAITGAWSWNVVIASLVYALGVTTVIFGKHIDKCEADRDRRIYTLPVLIGEKAGRYAVVSMFLLQYLAVVYLVLIGFFTPVMLVVFLAVRTLIQIWPMFRQPNQPKNRRFPEWPNTRRRLSTTASRGSCWVDRDADTWFCDIVTS
jgi:1,4-dihydroxy-2-naphthoate octaprenyltransferase